MIAENRPSVGRRSLRSLACEPGRIPCQDIIRDL